MVFYDEVTCLGKKGWICGFTTPKYAYKADHKGEYIKNHDKGYKQVSSGNLIRICHNNNWQYYFA